MGREIYYHHNNLLFCISCHIWIPACTFGPGHKGVRWVQHSCVFKMSERLFLYVFRCLFADLWWFNARCPPRRPSLSCDAAPRYSPHHKTGCVALEGGVQLAAARLRPSVLMTQRSDAALGDRGFFIEVYICANQCAIFFYVPPLPLWQMNEVDFRQLVMESPTADGGRPKCTARVKFNGSR